MNTFTSPDTGITYELSLKNDGYCVTADNGNRYELGELKAIGAKATTDIVIIYKHGEYFEFLSYFYGAGCFPSDDSIKYIVYYIEKAENLLEGEKE